MIIGPNNLILMPLDDSCSLTNDASSIRSADGAIDLFGGMVDLLDDAIDLFGGMIDLLDEMIDLIDADIDNIPDV